MKTALPQAVREFRAEYRKNQIPWFYSGEIHLIFTATVLLGTIGWHLLRVRAPGRLDLLVLAATLLLGNAAEYLIHRYPLHQVYSLFKPIYKIHSLEHHRFYVYEAMEFEGFKDFMMVLFPPWAPVLTALFTSAVGAWLVAPPLGANAGHFFAAGGTGTLFLYEILHGLAHFPDDGWAGKLPLVQGIRRHHRLHHDPRLMNRYNFNITFPVFDLILGTAVNSRPAALLPEGRTSPGKAQTSKLLK